MLLGGNLKMAYASIRSARWRSLLTVSGIVIGVVSVVTTISLGEGVRRQVVQQIAQRGKDVITILPGQPASHGGQSGQTAGVNPFAGGSSILFSEADYKTVEQVKSVDEVVPFGHVVGLVQTESRDYPSAQVIAATEATPQLLNQDLAFGSFYKNDETGRSGAVIGSAVARQLFRENVPMGKTFIVRDREFIVRGIFEEFPGNSPLFPGNNLNEAVFIPYSIGQELMGGNVQIYQMLATPVDSKKIDTTINHLSAALKSQRAGQEDFMILRQEESLALASEVLTSLTSLITGIAAISLVVGGIGIMNIMLVSVTERTVEIGVRKAVGATNRQILYQFMTEAAVISLFGGLLGVLLSILTNFLLRIFTDLQPVITVHVIAIACGMAFSIGVFFGMAPALKAARKDPIDALRYE